MKEKEKKTSSLKKKGGYVALYGTVAILLSLAVVISYNNSKPNNLEKGGITANIDPIIIPDENYAAVPKSSDYDYLAPGDRIVAQGDGQEITGAGQGNSSLKTSERDHFGPVTGNNSEEDGSAPVSASKDTPIPKTAPGPDKDGTDNEISSNELKPVSITVFMDDQSMEWPVLGEVVMKFSPDHGILDPTLEHYRTNNNICIAATEGTEVRAAAEGYVSAVFQTREDGNQVVLDHGNGWETTYTQLQDNILVKNGDVVKKGQIIGGVGKPSIYSVMLGCHLGFEVSKESEPVDPYSVLVKLD